MAKSDGALASGSCKYFPDRLLCYIETDVENCVMNHMDILTCYTPITAYAHLVYWKNMAFNPCVMSWIYPYEVLMIS